MSETQTGALLPSSVVSLANNHFRADHDGSMIIMSIAAGKFFSFDNVGFEIWDALEKPVRVDELAAGLAAKHNAPPEVVLRDVTEFLAKLVENELLIVE